MTSGFVVVHIYVRVVLYFYSSASINGTTSLRVRLFSRRAEILVQGLWSQNYATDILLFYVPGMQ